MCCQFDLSNLEKYPQIDGDIPENSEMESRKLDKSFVLCVSPRNQFRIMYKCLYLLKCAGCSLAIV